MKRVAAIHDLSCFGRGSLATAIPVLSGMGVQVCPLPTALLSTHTGGFENFSFLDLTDAMKKIIAHWKELHLTFDGIYSGFLGSPAQIGLVSEFIADFKRTGTLICVDPVMGDHGRMYSLYTDELIAGMRKLIGCAHVITPNLTEACLLAGVDYNPRPDEKTLTKLAKELFLLGPASVVITGIEGESRMDTAVFEKGGADGPHILSTGRVEGDYPGTGDFFASLLVGEILRGKPLLTGVKRAAFLTAEVIEKTKSEKTPPREGLSFEERLSQL